MICPVCEKNELPSPSDRFCLDCERRGWSEVPSGYEQPGLRCPECGALGGVGVTCSGCGGALLTDEERAELEGDDD